MYIKLSYLIQVFDSISNVSSISIEYKFELYQLYKKFDVTKKTYEYNLRLFMEFCSVHNYEDLIDALRLASKGYQIE
jgi:hypothetical protein